MTGASSSTGTRPPLLDRDYVLLHRRRRFAAAATRALHDAGPAGATVSAIVARAKSSRNSFYEVFDNVNDCLVFAISAEHERLLSPFREAESSPGDWSGWVERAVAGFYGGVVRDPLAAELLLVHSHSVEFLPAMAGFDACIDDIADLLALGRVAGPENRSRSAPEAAEEYWACVLLEAAVTALRRDELPGLGRTGQEIVAMVEATFLRPAQPSRLTSA